MGDCNHDRALVCADCGQHFMPHSEEMAALRTRLEAAEGLLRVMRESVNGLLMYEDDAIRDFAERRDPCPNVVTGPRKWLKRIREARVDIDAFLTGRAG